jgi:hypothetical protein
MAITMFGAVLLIGIGSLAYLVTLIASLVTRTRRKWARRPA